MKIHAYRALNQTRVKSDDRLPVVGKAIENPAWTVKQLQAPANKSQSQKSKFPILNGFPRGGCALRLQWNLRRPAQTRRLLHLRSRHLTILQTDPESHDERKMRHSSHDHFYVSPSRCPGRGLLPVHLLRAITLVRSIGEGSRTNDSLEPTSNLTGSGCRTAAARERGPAS